MLLVYIVKAYKMTSIQMLLFVQHNVGQCRSRNVVNAPKFLSNVTVFKYVYTMEYLDNGATYNTSLVSERTFSVVLKTHELHYIHGPG